MTAPGPADPREIRRALDVLIAPGQVVELRALDVADGRWRRTVSGYFDDMELLVEAAMKLSGHAKGVYITANPADPALLARRANRVEAITERDSLTADSHIVARRWFLVDFDAAPASGISTTDGEHGKAITRAELVREHLGGLGWPDPIFADSGNGAHLVYRVELPADVGDLIERCLAALHEQLGGDGVTIDRTVHNSSRIWKLYGTVARKGDNVSDRPHRLARMLSVPDDVKPVPRGLLESLAATAPNAQPANRAKMKAAGKSAKRRFDLADWIGRHQLDADGPHAWNGGQLWKFRVCPWNEDHLDGAWVAQLQNGALAAGCHHDSCSAFGWADLKALHASDDADDADAGGGDAAGPSQATRLLRLVRKSGAELWHTPAGDGFVTVERDGHGETFSLKSKQAQFWLWRLYYDATGGSVPGSQGVNDALNLMRAEAMFEGVEREIFCRVALHEGEFYIDLGGPDWNAVRVSDHDWEVVSNPPVRFRRPKGQRPLPMPVRGGNLALLRPFLNVANDDDFRLQVTVIVLMFWPTGPYPVVVINGEQGSAKSTTSRVIKASIDPNSTPLRAQSRDARDLMISASNGWVLAMDNLSGLPPWLSDALCRLATGGGLSTRELYSDDEEVLFEAQRPVVVNGIEDLATRSDLLDRTIAFVQPPIADGDRRDEEEFWAEFERARPQILGAILDALVVARRGLVGLRLSRMPRLADFARRGAALAPAVGWSAEDFLDAYADNRAAGHAAAVEDSVVAQALVAWFGDGGPWEGTASQLLKSLTTHVGEVPARARSWPKSARALANALRRLVPNLRALGTEVRFSRDTGRSRARLITICRADGEPGPLSSASSASSNTDSDGRAHADDRRTESWDVADVSSAPLRFTTDVADAAADGVVGSTAAACRCQGCPACRGLARGMHLAARLHGEYLRHGRCSWCLRAGGGAQ